jgi:hypothetical protein
MLSLTDKNKVKWLYRALHENFAATSVFTDPTAGPYFRLQRR